jgi:predicted ATPase
MSLIDLDPMARPTSAAEVIERLSAIASLEVDENLLVSQAHLIKPAFVGREQQINKIRKKIVRARRGLGSGVAVTGSSGTGRTRFLDICALEGKLEAATILRADANDAQSGNWGVVQALATRLLYTIPESAVNCAKPYIPVLGHILPELLERFKQENPSSSNIALETFEDPQDLRPRAMEALNDWIRKICEKQFIVIAVDDVHRIDEPSAAFVALLANRLSGLKIVLFATLDKDEPSTSATRLLLTSTSGINLRNLNARSTTELLRSIFGDVPQIGLLSDRLYKVAKGNPNAIMQIL